MSGVLFVNVPLRNTIYIVQYILVNMTFLVTGITSVLGRSESRFLYLWLTLLHINNL